MAIQAQFHSENLGFSLGRGGVSQGYVDNGSGVNDQFCINLQSIQLQQLQQQQQLQILQQGKNSLCFENSGLLPKSNNNQSIGLSQGISALMDKQRQEIDQFIRIQTERLRLGLMEQRQKQVAAILKQYETRANVLLRQKDEEIAKAVNKRVELENLLRGMEMESQTWQRMAKENEAMVKSLNNAIEQLKESAVCLSSNINGVAEDAESCCDVMVMDGRNRDNAAVENRGGFQENEEERKMFCKRCNSWNSCVIFLPCRHLCSCKACQAFLDYCPVCGMVKKSSIEALF